MCARLDGAGEDVAVVGLARGEGRAVVEGKLGAPFGKAQRLLEGVDRLPVGQDGSLRLGKGELLLAAELRDLFGCVLRPLARALRALRRRGLAGPGGGRVRA